MTCNAFLEAILCFFWMVSLNGSTNLNNIIIFTGYHSFLQLAILYAWLCPLLSTCNHTNVHKYYRTVIFHGSQRVGWFILVLQGHAQAPPWVQLRRS